ncbi:hypothetical protein SSTU70S_05588 [Stutzerimonas stutzeri]
MNQRTRTLTALFTFVTLASTSVWAAPDDEAGASDWQVTVMASYLSNAQEPVEEPVLDAVVQDGFCALGAGRRDRPQDHPAERRQKVCIGAVGDGRTSVVGQVFSNRHHPDAATHEQEADLVNGQPLNFVIAGDYLDATVGVYRVTVSRLARASSTASDL